MPNAGLRSLLLLAMPVAVGAGPFWWTERRTRAALDADAAPNPGLEVEGRNLAGRD